MLGGSQVGWQPLAVHRLEAELALEEARHHQGMPPGDCPGVVGRLNATRYLRRNDWKDPAYPERLYKSTAFAAYRPAMRALGMLTRSRRPELTDAGMHIGAAFTQSRGRSPRCLSDISSKEQSLLKVLLGVDYRTKSVAGAAATRRATFEVLRGAAADGSAALLEQHDRVPKRPSAVGLALHRAFVWELFSVGLTLAFSMLLVEHRKSVVARRLRQALAGRPRRPKLEDLSADHERAGEQVVGLLRAALKLGCDDLDPAPARLAQRLVGERDPNAFLEQLVARHRRAKPDSPWIALADGKVQLLAPKKSLSIVVRPRTYRLDAYTQILRDVGLLP